MRPIGFSTGALALGDFRAALTMLSRTKASVVELSALRDHEVEPLMNALPTLDLGRYRYVSVHAPSKFKTLTETAVADLLRPCIARKMPVVIHPDIIEEPACWQPFGSLLCIENMDKRKATGRTANELEGFFNRFPQATFCLDVAHARQIDTTMGEARRLLQRFGQRLRQVHISEIDSQGRHHGLTFATIAGGPSIAALIKPSIPIIIEAQVPASEIEEEIEAVERTLTPPERVTNWTNADWGALA